MTAERLRLTGFVECAMMHKRAVYRILSYHIACPLSTSEALQFSVRR